MHCIQALPAPTSTKNEECGHRPSPLGQSNNTTPPRHAQPNCTMAQAPPRLHHELDEELDSEDEEEVLLEELCSGWPSSGKGGSGGGSSIRCASITSHGGNNSGSGSKGDMVALKMKVACPRRPKSEALQHLAALRFPLLGATGHGNGLVASGAIVLPVVAAGTLPSKPWAPCG